MQIQRNYLLLLIISVYLVVGSQLGIAQSNLQTHIVVDITGQPLIQRGYWEDTNRFELLLLGDFVSNNDRIFIREGSGDQVTISCDNSSLITMTSSSSPKCEFIGSTIIPLPDNDESGSRGNEVVKLAIIQPIGKILPDSAVFRWLKQEGATYYEVLVTDSNFAPRISRPRLTRNTFELIDDTMEFVPGEYYFQVKALDNDEKVVVVVTEYAEISRQFEIVSEAVVEEVNNALTLRKLNLLDEDMQDFIRAITYANNDLYNDAVFSMMRAIDIDITSTGNFTDSQPQLNSLTSSTTPYMLLGTWFNKLGLYNLELESYQRALQLAQAYERLEEINMAKVALARFNFCNREAMLADAEAYFAQYAVFNTVSTFITELRNNNIQPNCF